MLYVITYSNHAFDIDGIAGVVKGNRNVKPLYGEFCKQEMRPLSSYAEGATFIEWLIEEKGFERVVFNQYALGE